MEHPTKSCKQPINVPRGCANCGKEHTANFKGCEDYQKLLQAKLLADNRRQAKIDLRQQRQMPSNSPPVRSQKSRQPSQILHQLPQQQQLQQRQRQLLRRNQQTQQSRGQQQQQQATRSIRQNPFAQTT